MKPPKDLPKMDAGLGHGPMARANAAPGRGLEIAGVAATVLWLILILIYRLVSPPEAGSGILGLIMSLLLAAMPIALIWVSVMTLRSVRELRAEASRLQETLDTLRASQMQSSAARPTTDRQTDGAAAATFSTRRDAALTVPSADRRAALVVPRPDQRAEQPALALGTPVEEVETPLQNADFVRALQFPETPDDKEGFRALRLALANRTAAKLIRSAQDVLTLLSQDGIYVDDLQPDLCQPELWRRFSGGERGRSIAALGGIRDRNALALTAARMKADPVFRDAAHHFLRTFDKTFSAFEPEASDSELADLSDTRTARAFMLFGRVTGTFD